jgi:hypothetical protein
MKMNDIIAKTKCGGESIKQYKRKITAVLVYAVAVEGIIQYL